eukprot:GHVS01032583.1.p1 GENE.GHVS01032583.1~~GHVS01032583.1.p1  ORF type:complete len:506 (+),score=115.73 GHVS01032583.1:190-1707(+)
MEEDLELSVGVPKVEIGSGGGVVERSIESDEGCYVVGSSNSLPISPPTSFPVAAAAVPNNLTSTPPPLFASSFFSSLLLPVPPTVIPTTTSTPSLDSPLLSGSDERPSNTTSRQPTIYTRQQPQHNCCLAEALVLLYELCSNQYHCCDSAVGCCRITDQLRFMLEQSMGKKSVGVGGGGSCCWENDNNNKWIADETKTTIHRKKRRRSVATTETSDPEISRHSSQLHSPIFGPADITQPFSSYDSFSSNSIPSCPPSSSCSSPSSTPFTYTNKPPLNNDTADQQIIHNQLLDGQQLQHPIIIPPSTFAISSAGCSVSSTLASSPESFATLPPPNQTNNNSDHLVPLPLRNPLGVYYDAAKRLWRAQWNTGGGRGRGRKVSTRGFSVMKHGHAEARQLAMQFRIDMQKLGVPADGEEQLVREDLRVIGGKRRTARKDEQRQHVVMFSNQPEVGGGRVWPADDMLLPNSTSSNRMKMEQRNGDCWVGPTTTTGFGECWDFTSGPDGL